MSSAGSGLNPARGRGNLEKLFREKLISPLLKTQEKRLSGSF